MAQTTATLARNAIAAALAPTGHPHPLLAEQAREHAEPAAAPTFEDVKYRLIEAGGALEDLIDARPYDERLKSALFALGYVSDVIEAFAEAEAGE